MQMTTREAVEAALDAMYDNYVQDSGCSAAHIKQAMEVLASYHGVRLEKYFGFSEAL